jgi:hypothetical protein
MHDFVKSLGSEWFIFKYEDMIEKNFDALNEYLGLTTTKKSKVARKKAMGDWRQWYTEEDVELFKPVYKPYMELIGYDCDDWTLSPEPIIEPDFSSAYIKRLVRQNTVNTETGPAEYCKYHPQFQGPCVKTFCKIELNEAKRYHKKGIQILRLILFKSGHFV